MTRRKPTLRSDNQWQSVLTQQSNSSLNVSAFCKLHKISISSFYSAKKRLEPLNNEQVLVGKTLHDLKSESVFVQLQPKPSELAIATSNNKWDVELEIGQNIILRVRT